LWVAVLCALAIHGGVAAMRLSFPSVMLETGHVIERPLRVRLVASHIEESKQIRGDILLPEEKSETVIDIHEEIETPEPAMPDVAVPMDREEVMKEKAAPVAPAPAFNSGKVKTPARRAITPPPGKTQPIAEGKTKLPVAPSETHANQIMAEPATKKKTVTTKTAARPDVVAAVPRYRDNPPPSYPSVARRRGYEGLVILSVMVCTDGTVGDVRVKESSGKKILDRAAISGVRTWRFEPGARDGVVCEMAVDVPIRFVLQK